MCPERARGSGTGNAWLGAVQMPPLSRSHPVRRSHARDLGCVWIGVGVCVCYRGVRCHGTRAVSWGGPVGLCSSRGAGFQPDQR